MSSTFQIWPKYLYPILYFSILLLLVTIIIKNREDKKAKSFHIFSFFYITTVGIIMTNLPIILTSAGYMPRAVYTFASILGVLIFYLIIINKNSKKLNTLLAFIMLLTLFVTLYRFNIIAIDHYILNSKDKDVSLRIGELISEYEEKNHIEVKKISFYKDKNAKGSYSKMFQLGNLNQSAFIANWSDSHIVNYFNNLHLEKVENNLDLKVKFEQEDFTQFTDENVVFIDDTIHICVW